MSTFKDIHNGFIRKRRAMLQFIQRVNPEDPQLTQDEIDEAITLIEFAVKYLNDFRSVRPNIQAEGNSVSLQVCDDSISELESLKEQLECIKDKDEELYQEALDNAKN